MTTYTIGEPTQLPRLRHAAAKWQVLFAEMDSRLPEMGDVAIPVHFETAREARNCISSLQSGRNPSRLQRDHYPLLMGSVRGDAVFFWLKKEAPNAPTT